jgi:hypothetical protein
MPPTQSPPLGFTRFIIIFVLLLVSGGAFYYFASSKEKEAGAVTIVPPSAAPAVTPVLVPAPANLPPPAVVPAPAAKDSGNGTLKVTATAQAPDNKPKKRPPPQPIPVPIQMATPAKSPAAQGAVQAPSPMPKKPTFTLADLKAQVPQDKDGNFQLELPELYMATGDRQVATVLDGQKVETVARVLPEKADNADGHKVRLFALVVSCCAADAQPVTIAADFGKKAPAFKDMTWVKVHGIMRYKTADNDRLIPLIEATEMVETESQDGKSLF